MWGKSSASSSARSLISSFLSGESHGPIVGAEFALAKKCLDSPTKDSGKTSIGFCCKNPSDMYWRTMAKTSNWFSSCLNLAGICSSISRSSPDGMPLREPISKNKHLQKGNKKHQSIFQDLVSLIIWIQIETQHESWNNFDILCGLPVGWK